MKIQRKIGYFRSKRIKGRIYWYLVRSIRRDGKPRQEVIGYLGGKRPASIQAAMKMVTGRRVEKERKLEIERVCALPAADFYAYLNLIRPEDNEVGGTVATARLWWELERMKRRQCASPWKKRMALKRMREKLERQH